MEFVQLLALRANVGVIEGGTWDPADDPSYRAAAGPNPGVPLYEGTTLVWGAEPGSTPTPTPTTPTPTTPTPTPSSTTPYPTDPPPTPSSSPPPPASGPSPDPS